MPIAPGTRLGPYEIAALLGAGGMGEVYRAKDTRLNREVAIKILPDSVVDDNTRRIRFEQEARSVAALSHPNIVAVYDVGHNYIVSELVDGESLRALLRHGPVSARRVIDIGAQIAGGLALAHSARVIHRDVKPENILLTRDGRVKIVDFGLATHENRSGDNPDRTATVALTDPGTIVGTVSYMSPEQVRSRPLDHRSDIFSLGVVLYEMLTGTQPFAAGSAVETMNAVLKEDPRELPDSTPPILSNIVRRCLEKDPQARFQSASDLAFALRTASSAPIRTSGTVAAGITPSLWRQWWFRVAAGMALLAVLAFGAWRSDLFVKPAPATFWVLKQLTYDTGLTTDPALSPDGKLIAYASDRAGGSGLDLWVQHLAGGSTIRLTKDAGDEVEPDFSPDGGQLVFRSNRDGGGIYIVPVLGGEPRLIARGGHRPRFSPDGTMIAYWTGTLGSALGTTIRHVYVIPISAGGTPALLSGELDAAFPVWSEDGRRILFATSGYPKRQPPDWYVAGLDGSHQPLEITKTFQSLDIDPFFSPPGRWIGGHVIFPARPSEQGQPRIWRMQLTDAAKHPALEMLTNGTGSEDRPSAISSGAIAVSSVGVTSDVWAIQGDVNTGKALGDPVRVTNGPALETRVTSSADGKRLLYLSTRAGNADVWLRDLQSGAETQLTSTPGDETWPAISRDASRISYVSGPTLFTISLPRGLPVKLTDTVQSGWGLSSDGRYGLAGVPTAGRSVAIAIETSSLKSWTVARRPDWGVLSPRLSFDSKWIAFHARNSELSRRIFIAPFYVDKETSKSEWIPITDGTALDRDPEWSPDGSLIYFLTDRDGFRCIAAQRVNPAAKQPIGELFYVKHLHEAGHSMLFFNNTALTSVAASANKLFFVLAERTGNIWLMRPAESSKAGQP